MNQETKLRWSVMIPTYNCAGYLEKALTSVLNQDPGQDHMQIEVIDDCSTNDDPEEVVKRVGKGRVTFFRQPGNVGATANFNSCAARAKGELVHILHGDDWVENGFYTEIDKLAIANPELALYATRSFFVDERGIIQHVTDEIPSLSQASKDNSAFFYSTPIQFAGIVVRKSFYETNRFDAGLIHSADVDLWSRAIFEKGGIISPLVLSAYRIFSSNDTSKLKKTGGNIEDLLALGNRFKNRYPAFSFSHMNYVLSVKALRQALLFQQSGETAAAAANLKIFFRIAGLRQKVKFFLNHPGLITLLLQ